MGKKETGIISILSEGAGLYFSNFGRFFSYMAFPVFGQILGLVLIFGLTFLYTSNLPFLVANFKFFDNFLVIITISFLITLPGFIVLLKAFWEYLIAYGAINSMVDSMLKTGKLYDFPAHNQVITGRTNSYIILWILYGLFIMFSLNIVFWVIGFVFFIYFILIFQVFAEEGASPLECFRRSLILIKGNFAKTLVLTIVIGSFTYFVIPQLVIFLIDLIKGISFLAVYLQLWTSQLPLEVINSFLLKFNFALLTPFIVAVHLISLIIYQIIIQLTLPLRVICWCLWYKHLNKIQEKSEKKTQKK